MEMHVSIRDGGEVELVAFDAREDFFRDYSYFVERARNLSVNDESTTAMQRRFLRAALFTLFAYTEAVVNAWLYHSLEERGISWMFKGIERNRVEDKMGFLDEMAATSQKTPNIADARRVRNLLVHFKPGNDALLSEQVTLTMVDRTYDDINGWMSQMEAALGVQRHPNTKQEVEKFIDGMTEGGVTVNHIQDLDS